MSRHIVQIAVAHTRVVGVGDGCILPEVEVLVALDNNGMVWRMDWHAGSTWYLLPELPSEKDVPTRLRSQEIGE